MVDLGNIEIQIRHTMLLVVYSVPLYIIFLLPGLKNRIAKHLCWDPLSELERHTGVYANNTNV